MLKDLLLSYRKRSFFDSAVCCILDEETTLEKAHVGPAAENAYFDMASVSKLITTTLLLHEMDAGHLSPTDPILPRLPQLQGPACQARLSETTVADLMTHHSGILPWYPFYADGRPFEVIFEEILSSTVPEAGEAYSDLNFMLLRCIYENVSGKSLSEGVREVINGQLVIPDIRYGPLPADACAPCCLGNQIEKDMCHERGMTFDAWRTDGVPVAGTCNDGNAFYYFKGISGHAGIFATVSAMEALCRFYLTTDCPSFVNAMQVHLGTRGLGFDCSDVFPEGCGHLGFTGTSLYVSRSRHIGVVLLSNRLYLPSGAKPTNITPCRREIHAYALEQYGSNRD